MVLMYDSFGSLLKLCNWNGKKLDSLLHLSYSLFNEIRYLEQTRRENYKLWIYEMIINF